MATSTSVKIFSIKCPFGCKDPTTGEVFEWTPRVPNPKKCPNCARQLAKVGKLKLREGSKSKYDDVMEEDSSAASDVGEASEQVAEIVPDSPPLISVEEEEVGEHVPVPA